MWSFKQSPRYILLVYMKGRSLKLVLKPADRELH